MVLRVCREWSLAIGVIAQTFSRSRAAAGAAAKLTAETIIGHGRE
jgi:hypothetical protein